MEELAYVGVLCVEFFLTERRQACWSTRSRRGRTTPGISPSTPAITSQFEQQVRAICGLPLGATTLLRPAAMANLLGDVWATGEPKWDAALAVPDVKLHLYGKTRPLKGRKMGHLTAMADTPAQAIQHVLAGARRARLEASKTRVSTQPTVVFTDGAAKRNPGPGGWGVVVVTPDGHVTELGGGARACQPQGISDAGGGPR